MSRVITILVSIITFFPKLFCELAIWLLPSNSKYGTWPRSGEIDLVELRGNIKYGDNEEIGVEQMSSALHFGPVKGEKRSIVFKRNSARGFHESYHKYECIWDDSSIKFLLDGVQYGHAPVEEDGFLNGEKFPGDKIWKSGTKMAPFDEEVIFGFLVVKPNWNLNFHSLSCVPF